MTAERRVRDEPMARLDVALFCVLVSLLAIRPLMSETFEHVRLSFLPASAGGPTPGTTALLDALVLAAAGAALVRHPPRTRTAKLAAVGVALVIAAAIVSSACANDKRAAINASSSFCVALLSAGALASLSRREWCASVILAALLATGLAGGWKCVAQWWFEFDQTWEAWQEQKAALAASGRNVDDPSITNFERRLAAHEPFGYLAHPNLAASCMVMSALAAAGLAAGVIADRRIKPGSRAAPLIVAAALLGMPVLALLLIRSLGADVAAIGGGVLFVLMGFGVRRCSARPGLTTAVLAATYGGVLVGGALFGWLRGGLPHPSLAFRWHYWSAAGQAWRTAPLTGIGRGNFATAFERFKPAENPEEVRDAHNVWVTLLVEMGPAAVLATAVLLLLWLVRVLRGMGEGSWTESSARAPPLALGLPILLAPALHAVFSRHEMLLAGSAPLVLYWLLEVALLWGAGYLAAAGVLRALCEPRHWLAVGLAASVLAVLIHNLVDFSLNTPAGGALAILAAVGALAAAGGGSGPDEASAGPAAFLRPWRAGHAVPWLAACVMVAAHVGLVVVPTLFAERALDELQRALALARTRGEAGDAMLRAERAASFDPWDAGLPREIANIAAQVAQLDGVPGEERLRWIGRGLEMAELAAQRAPQTADSWRTLARLNAARAEALEAGTDGQRAAALDAARSAASDWERAIELYPTHVRTRIEAAKAYFALWQRFDASAGGRAAALFNSALALNDRFPPEEVVRLSREELASIEAHLRHLSESAAATQPVTTRGGG